MNSSSKEIHLIGAGLAGCLLSLYFARRGFQVQIFESRPDMRRNQISAGRSINLSLSERGIVALKEVGCFEKIKRHLVAMPGRMIHDIEGQLHFQNYGLRKTDLHYSLSRGTLNEILMTEAENTGNVKINFEHPCHGMNFEESTIEVEDLQNKKTVRLPVRRVIATDGAPSAIRQSMKKQENFQCEEQLLTHSYKELCIPPTKDGGYQMEKNALHIWPRGGFMLIALPNRNGSFTVTLFLANEGQESFSDLKSKNDVERFFQKYFPDAFDLLENLEEDFFQNPTGKLGTIRCFPWHIKDRALLLGDAAHAIVPFHGQGMNCAFEDCLELDHCLDEMKNDDWEEVFKTYEKRRKKNADAIADMALENYIEMRDSVRKEKFHLKKKIEWALEEKFPNCFIARYSMVMFHPQIPYSLAYERGEIQRTIVSELSSTITDISQLDWKKAESLVSTQLGSFSRR